MGRVAEGIKDDSLRKRRGKWHTCTHTNVVTRHVKGHHTRKADLCYMALKVKNKGNSTFLQQTFTGYTLCSRCFCYISYTKGK